MTGDCRVLSGSRIDAYLKVSILMITYNQESFISQAIDSVLMQKVNFDYEIVLGEDCSTDKTRNIVIDFQRRYPDKVRLLLREYNLGMMNNFIHTFQALKGQYIAMLEGDDYWTDPYKLQKQVDLLESHPECAICFHDVEFVCEDQDTAGHVFKPSPKTISTIEDIIKGNFIFTASCMFRNGLFESFPEWYYSLGIGDWPLHVLNAQYGKIGYIDEIMAAHRVHRGGYWSRQSRLETLDRLIETARRISVHFGSKYSEYIIPTILRWEQERIIILVSSQRYREASRHAWRVLSKPILNRKVAVQTVVRVLLMGLRQRIRIS